LVAMVGSQDISLWVFKKGVSCLCIDAGAGQSSGNWVVDC